MGFGGFGEDLVLVFETMFWTRGSSKLESGSTNIV